MGYGSSLMTVRRVAPRVKANRVVYQRSGLSEWYANGPLGLEQGFTVARAPAGHASGPLTLTIALSGDTRAALARGGESINLNRAGRTALRYAGLSASDARGRTLHSWLALDGRLLLVHVDASGARYPLQIDPFVQQGGKLTGEKESGDGWFGYSVALSSNGNTALIGGPFDAEVTGAVWVFTRSGSAWNQQAELTGGGEQTGAGDFGESVALSSDGNTALIGGIEDNGFVGAAWVFTRASEKWTQQGSKLTGTGESGKGHFGSSVALSSDGNTALIGGSNDNSETGAAWVFTRSAEKWTQQGGKLTGKKAESGAGEFGESLALSSDGNTALIGGPGDNIFVGAAWVFTRSSEKWTEQGGKLTGGEEIPDAEFGQRVALSGDGNTALIGGGSDNSRVGAAWVFTRSSEEWTQQGSKLTGAEETGKGYFGGSVALSSNGNTALIGGPGDNGERGATWVFARSAGKWTQQGAKLTGSGEAVGSVFGGSVALSEDGNTALTGGSLDNAVGAAWVFANSVPPTVETGSASEVTTVTATANATVNPEGLEVSKCEFEYGTTEAYGQIESCSVLPGSGESAVSVSAPLIKLVADTTYHFRISATNAASTSLGVDHTFTTLETFKTGTTKEPTMPAEAKDEGLSVRATEGTGSVTVGAYGPDIAGPPLAGGKGVYFQVYHSEEASFKTIEYKDCELGGAKAIWWDNPTTGWEPIAKPTAVYTASPEPCVTVTATESTTPSIAQLSDPRHVGGPGGTQEIGQCREAKKALFSERSCATPDVKNGKGKGKWEWYTPPLCYALKHGHWGTGCDSEVFKENKKKERKYKGSFEKGASGFTGTGRRRHGRSDGPDAERKSGYPQLRKKHGRRRAGECRRFKRDAHLQRLQARRGGMRQRRRAGGQDRNQQA